MVDTFSGNVAMTIIPRGGDNGTWDTGTNLNWNAVDGMIGGVQSYSLTNANRTVALPVGFTPTPAAGPTEAQNAMLKFTGTLTGNCVITCTRPGYFICYNACTVGAFYVSLWNGSGNAIGLPPGRLQHVFNDGTNYYFVNLPDIGTFVDYCGVTAVPAWIGASTVPPYLLCDGSVYNTATYPFLGTLLGSTFGGNGSTTFGVPDHRNRFRAPIGGTRITSAGSGVDGATVGSAGGNELMQSHTHVFTGTQQTWASNSTNTNLGGTSAFQLGAGTGGTGNTQLINNTTNNTPNTTVTPAGTNATTGSGASQNMPPVIITGISLIRAG